MNEKMKYLAGVFCVIAIFLPNAYGGTNTWDGSADMDWTEPDATSWGGETYVSGNTVQFLGAGAGTIYVSTNGTGITPGDIIVDSSSNYQFLGNGIGGSGTLFKSGGGSLSMNDGSAVHTFSGDVIISGGSIIEVRNGGLGNGTNLIFAGNATFSPDYGAYPVFTHGVTVNEGVIATFSGSTFYFKSYWDGPLQGSGTLQISGGNNTQTQFRNATNTFTGTLQYSGSTGFLYVNSLADAPNPLRLDSCKFVLNSGSASPLVFNQRHVELYGNNANTVYINNSNGTLTNTISINTDLVIPVAQNKTLQLEGNNGGLNTFGGIISNAVGKVTSVTKANTGKWILAGTNTYAGTTTISGGTLVLAGEASIGDSNIVNITAGTLEVMTKEIIGELRTNGVAVANGVWGTTASGAPNVNDVFLSGNGLLYVGVPFPPQGTVITVR